MKLATSAGVGLFLGIIALEEAHVVVAQPATLVTLGDLKNPAAILMLLGFVLIIALNYRRVIGGTLIGILAVTIIGLPLGLAHYSGIMSLPPSIAPTLLQPRLLARIRRHVPDRGVLDPIHRRVR